VWRSQSDDERSRSPWLNSVTSTWPRGLVLGGLVWLTILAIPGAIGVIIVTAIADDPGFDQHARLKVIAMGISICAAFLATGIVGFSAWRYRTWRALAVTALIGTCWLMVNYCFIYILVAEITDPRNSSSDIGAAAGMVILSVPTFVVTATMLGLGAVVAWLWSRVSHDRQALS